MVQHSSGVEPETILWNYFIIYFIKRDALQRLQWLQLLMATIPLLNLAAAVWVGGGMTQRWPNEAPPTEEGRAGYAEACQKQ